MLSELLKIKLLDEERAIINYFLSNGKIKPKEKPEIIKNKNLYYYMFRGIDKNNLIESLKNEKQCEEVFKAQYECVRLFYKAYFKTQISIF